MSWIITSKGRGGYHLFLVDRKQVHDKWWSTDLNDAIQYEKRTAAVYVTGRLTFRSPEVISYDQARELEAENEYRESQEEHPFNLEP